jgi:hypothetical protein
VKRPYRRAPPKILFADRAHSAAQIIHKIERPIPTANAELIGDFAQGPQVGPQVRLRLDNNVRKFCGTFLEVDFARKPSYILCQEGGALAYGKKTINSLGT